MEMISLSVSLCEINLPRTSLCKGPLILEAVGEKLFVTSPSLALDLTCRCLLGSAFRHLVENTPRSPVSVEVLSMPASGPTDGSRVAFSVACRGAERLPWAGPGPWCWDRTQTPHETCWAPWLADRPGRYGALEAMGIHRI